jgi:signal transduction histidine kinase
LKNPLNGIVGYSALLGSDYDSYSREEVREMLEAIHESALSLDRLVDRFMRYTELVLQATNPERANRSLVRIAGNAGVKLESVARRITARHGRQGDLVMQLGVMDATITVEQLLRLAEELLDNACKFSPRDSKIELVTGTQGKRFVLEVIDKGRGMTADQIVDAGAFQQFDRRRYEKQDMGLGLATARFLAELNGGTLTLRSEPGQGTTATVSLPLAA